MYFIYFLYEHFFVNSLFLMKVLIFETLWSWCLFVSYFLGGIFGVLISFVLCPFFTCLIFFMSSKKFSVNKTVFYLLFNVARTRIYEKEVMLQQGQSFKLWGPNLESKCGSDLAQGWNCEHIQGCSNKPWYQTHCV